MLQLFPFLSFGAVTVSVVLLVAAWVAGETSRPRVAALAGVAVVAACAQFFGRSSVESAAGLAVQTLLAVGLLIRWRLE